MKTPIVKKDRSSSAPSVPKKRSRSCARDRLLAALDTSPRLRSEERELIERAVKEAREASLADELSA